MYETSMDIEVVVNDCYGGYSLSDTAYKRLAELDALPKIERLQGEDDANYRYRQIMKIERSNPSLVQVVKELGSEASDQGSELIVRTVRVTIDIDSRDGWESLSVHGYEL